MRTSTIMVKCWDIKEQQRNIIGSDPEVSVHIGLSFPDLEAKKTSPLKIKPELFLGLVPLPPERKYGNSGKRAVPTDHDLPMTE